MEDGGRDGGMEGGREGGREGWLKISEVQYLPLSSITKWLVIFQ